MKRCGFINNTKINALINLGKTQLLIPNCVFWLILNVFIITNKTFI